MGNLLHTVSDGISVLRDMAQRIEADYQKDVQFIFLSETTDPQLMKEFVAKNVKILPQKIPLYLDENENFARILRYFQRGGVCPAHYHHLG